jgi:hypothetical protein
MATMSDINEAHAKAHVKSVGMKWLGHHKCGGCRTMVGYEFVPVTAQMIEGATQDDFERWGIDGEGDVVPAFNSSCGCGGPYEQAQIKPWSEFIHTFKMQDSPEKQLAMYERFLAGEPTHEPTE